MVHGEISLSRSWLAMVTGFKISNVGASGQGASELPVLVMGLRRLIPFPLQVQMLRVGNSNFVW